ncbi:hypothetical protein [Photobacterium galatheae]|uniref:Uncharacterized protein n=1 Tax=Photobacterium galatheae TaxID=1654360 RepID=A0A066RT12_9GAMM|nr:hypothetical protein [Photobacterium galatheae]KDM90827.1 hypothetical protein EA58_13785 [Photobacterium galatheae]MCM0149205.1 hypothetical protein [Photobacterium galatheae]
MVSLKNSNQNLGFTPIAQEEVFNLSPKLKDLFEKLGEFDVHFKQPEHVKVSLGQNQKLIQGSMTMPHSPEIVDFELSTDYLMTNANLITMTRIDGSDIWGDNISVSNDIRINNANDLKDELTKSMSLSASETAMQNTKSLDDASVSLDKQIEMRNKHLSKHQDTPEKMDNDYAEKVNPRRLMH